MTNPTAFARHVVVTNIPRAPSSADIDVWSFRGPVDSSRLAPRRRGAAY